MHSEGSDLYTVGDDGTIELAVHAQPGAGRTQITGRHGSALKVRVAAPPEHGRANAALIKALAEAFGEDAVIDLVAGERSRAKRFRIEGLDPEVFAGLLETYLSAGPRPPRAVAERDRRR